MKIEAKDLRHLHKPNDFEEPIDYRISANNINSDEGLLSCVGTSEKGNSCTLTLNTDNVFHDAFEKAFMHCIPHEIVPPLVTTSFTEEIETKERIKIVNDGEGHISGNIENKEQEPIYTLSINVWFALNISRESLRLEMNGVYMRNKWDGMNFTPEFLLDLEYDKNQEGEPNYFAFLVQFQVKSTVLPKTFTTYIWKNDPEGSRGTVSDPQSGG